MLHVHFQVQIGVLKWTPSVLLHSNLSTLREATYYKQNPNRRKRIELWAKTVKIYGKFGCHFPRAIFAEIRVAFARVCRKLIAHFFFF